MVGFVLFVIGRDVGALIEKVVFYRMFSIEMV